MTARYKIADRLCHVGDPLLQVFVVSIVTEECPGGTQYHYHCRVFDHSGFSAGLIKFNEIELMPIPQAITLKDMARQLKEMAVNANELELAAEIRAFEKKQSNKA